MNNKKITKPIICAAIILGIFYAIEIAMVYLNLFPDNNILFCVDIILRIIFGTVSLILLRGYSNSNESKYSVKQLFTNKVALNTWLVLIPFILYIVAPFFKLFTAYLFTTSVLGPFIIIVIQQFATGYFEEATHRGLMMNGLLKYNTDTIKQRLVTVIIAGTFFGLSHIANIFFGENPLVQVPPCILSGMFIAAVYMLSDNLLLVMILHALSDTTYKIPNALFGYVHDAAICQVVEYARTAINYVILPLMAVLICIFYDKLKRKEVL